jgi:hypothetical protein
LLILSAFIRWKHGCYDSATLGIYDPGMLRTLVLPILTLSICTLASASPLLVTAGGTFSSGDTADALVTPGDMFSLSFIVDSNPALLPADYDSDSFEIPVTDFDYALNGTPVSATPTDIRFFTSALGGGFEVDFPTADADAEFLFGPDQLFSGPTSAPVFSVGTFASDTWTLFDDNNVDAGTASPLQITPEPSSIPVLLCGGLALVAVRFKKLAENRQ